MKFLRAEEKKWAADICRTKICGRDARMAENARNMPRERGHYGHEKESDCIAN